MDSCGRSKSSVVNASISVDLLASFIFIDNVNDQTVLLSLHGIDGAFGLFNFFISILSQGILLLTGQQSIDIEKISQETFAVVIKKMENCMIKVNLNVQDSIHNISTVQMVTVGDTGTLKDYELHLHAVKSMFVISFELLNHKSIYR